MNAEQSFLYAFPETTCDKHRADRKERARIGLAPSPKVSGSPRRLAGQKGVRRP